MNNKHRADHHQLRLQLADGGVVNFFTFDIRCNVDNCYISHRHRTFRHMCRSDYSNKNYLSFRFGHTLISGIFRFAWWLLSPNSKRNTCVREYQHEQRQNKLQDQQGERIVVIVQWHWPMLLTNISENRVKEREKDEKKNNRY